MDVLTTEIERVQARIAELTERIVKSPGWGAAVGAMHEERRNLEASLNWLLCDRERAEASQE